MHTYICWIVDTYLIHVTNVYLPGSEVESNVASHMRMTGGVDRIIMHPFNSPCTSSTYLRHVATFPIAVILFCGGKVRVCPGSARWKASNRERWQRRGGWKDSRENSKFCKRDPKIWIIFLNLLFCGWAPALSLNCGTKPVFMSDAFGLSVFLREIPLLLLHPTTVIAPYSEPLASQRHFVTPKPQL